MHTAALIVRHPGLTPAISMIYEYISLASHLQELPGIGRSRTIPNRETLLEHQEIPLLNRYHIGSSARGLRRAKSGDDSGEPDVDPDQPEQSFGGGGADAAVQGYRAIQRRQHEGPDHCGGMDQFGHGRGEYFGTRAGRCEGARNSNG